ncbi:MAG: hypothetical protein IPP07_27970 [Holophagales bacterium]|nr:hypothetical protein [Holophagales bacterium]MBK9968491.1 hypothetical protein [Holophagales bacterium]
MKRRLALLLLLAGTFVAARIVVAQTHGGRSPALAPLALHAVAVPLVQLGLLEGVHRFRARRTGVA